MTKLNKLSTETIRDFEEVEIANKDNPNLIYVKEPNSFSTTKQLDRILSDDIQQVRDWKNKVIEIRDKHKGSELFVMWDLEAKRIVDFLSNLSE
tara:strand:- start:920 stop:1201 length:282 start_codon:yes stop_codon:yes gene_type:complete